MMPVHPSLDPYRVCDIRCDISQKDSSKAKELLERVAKQVQPVMRKHSWSVPLLSELYSCNSRVWGLNIGGGGGTTKEIKLRLRESGSSASFLSYDFILGTMLHELVHNVHGPHNATFYALLDKINDELDEFIAKGITGTGEGFDAPSMGRLGAGGFGGHNPSPALLRNKMLQAAEARARTGNLMQKGPHRLGGISQNLTPQQEALGSASAQSSAAAIAATGPHHVLYKENAVTGETAPPSSTDLLLADDTRVWEPLRPIWQRLRLATICQLWAAYQRGHHQPDAHTSPGQLAVRILSSCIKALLADWRIATAYIQLRKLTEDHPAQGFRLSIVFHDWLRGRDPTLSREQFIARWRHRGVLCTMDALPDAQPVVRWSAQYPIAATELLAPSPFASAEWGLKHAAPSTEYHRSKDPPSSALHGPWGAPSTRETLASPPSVAGGRGHSKAVTAKQMSIPRPGGSVVGPATSGDQDRSAEAPSLAKAGHLFKAKAGHLFKVKAGRRTPRWHQRAVNSSRLSVGLRPRSQSLSTPADSRMLAVASCQSARRAFLQEDAGCELPGRCVGVRLMTAELVGGPELADGADEELAVKQSSGRDALPPVEMGSVNDPPHMRPRCGLPGSGRGGVHCRGVADPDEALPGKRLPVGGCELPVEEERLAEDRVVAELVWLRVTAWRLLHGQLFVGGFARHVHRADPAGHVCPHPSCAGQLATLTHVFIICPLAAGVWDWFAATWAAVTGDDAPPRSADLLLADDTRIWGPPRQLRQLWDRLRLATICQLWAAYQRGRHQPDAAAITPGAVAARILSSCKKALLADWRLATVNVRQTAGVLSDWLRGRDPMITREQFAARWCHRAVLCALEELPGAQPVIHWSAQHPVPLPA
ncbi:WLM-domain-containing protein [Coccomyxa subellipsoidea C-169]|uniref:WLM-domain-containing protein n=1 Tax=Coccomyxa subellipsoidea (strain C-169) TaxID=574566 RepID=I0YWP7_COCSC|nr:WLM-domain-containing protein [Coccomyxa subellipsoidea C-169]EIE22816.1 WLM-domain-containing protein [Coccomyxa subellipsoidea C-169]|eukprot:XP_005647360.1 WLM-domain-containing protein [Coccomyxa subellipsoidea C-169]